MGCIYFLTAKFMAFAMRFTEPACRLSFAVISRIGAPPRTSRINACFSASVHSFGFGLIAQFASFGPPAMNSSSEQFQHQHIEDLRTGSECGITRRMTEYTSESTKLFETAAPMKFWLDDGRPAKFFNFDDLLTVGCGLTS